jgi:hypothetical protein
MEERSTERVLVDLVVEASSLGKPLRVFMYDLSMDGCMIEACLDGLPRPETPINVYIPHANVTRGTLVWADGHIGGVRFNERMHEAVVLHLGFKSRLEEREGFRDRFGRPVSLRGERFNLRL